jgi:hypothetical protein
MISVGVPVAVAICKEHQYIGKQVRQRMQTIRHQGLRMRKKSAHYLERRQQHIDAYTHPGAFLRGGKTLRVHRFESPDIVAGWVCLSVIFHVG